MAALYSNENYPLGIVEQLRALGHDVLTSREAGNADRGVSDEEVLAFATAHGRAVITHNRKHFFRLHTATAGDHAGIIACTFDPNEGRQAARVHAALCAYPDGLHGKVIRVYRPG
jgi:predicted nuclease of predicted toxin-antitoxin system